MKKILSLIIIAAILTGSALSLNSCDKPEIFKLADLILTGNRQNERVENFNAEINIKINKDYLYESGILLDFEDAELDAVPDEINFKSDGYILHAKDKKFCDASFTLYLENYSLMIRVEDGVLIFENNEVTRIILDLLTATGFVDFPVKQIFSELAYEKSGFFHIDLDNFDLSWFEQYAEQADKTFEITSKLNIRRFDMPVAIAPLPDVPALHFEEIKARTEKKLLSIPGYRYSELSIILSPDNYLHILATRENGASEILEALKLNIRTSAVSAKIAEDPRAFWTENIIPMRYILELMGDEVGWDDTARKPFIIREGENIYFDAVLRSSRSYTSLLQILAQSRYSVSLGEAGEYLDFKIKRE